MKTRDFAAWLMLTAATLPVLNGCITTSTTPWETVKTETRDTGREREITEKGESKKMRERSFVISDAYIEDNKYKTKITESLKELTYDTEKKRSVKVLEEIATEQRKMQDGLSVPVFSVIGGGAIGTLIERLFTPKNKDITATGPLAGAIALGLISLLFPPVTIKTETRTNKAGTREGYSALTIEAEKFAGEKWLYRNKASGSIRFGRKGDSNTYRIGDGTLTWINEPNKAITREELEGKLYDIPLIQEILPETREIIRQRLVDAIEENREELEIETREPNLIPTEKVINASKVLWLRNYQITNEEIYGIVQKFVDEEINSRIKTLSISVREELSHTPIENFNFEFATNAPSKYEVAGKYFTGSLRTLVAERNISDYLTGRNILKNCTEITALPVYPSSRISVEVTNPYYNFALREFDVRGNMQEVIDMIDRGNKIRIEGEEGRTGRIE